MNIIIEEKGKIPIYLQIANEIKRQICDGSLGLGCGLPSERALANMLGVHRNTVTKAYNELKSEEYIDSIQGKGYVVISPKAEDLYHFKDYSGNKKKSKKVNWKSLIKDDYLDMEVTFDDLFQRFRDKDVISLGSGISSPGIYDRNKIAQDISEMICEEGKNQYFYSPYKGDKYLRQQLVNFLSRKSITTSTSHIQVLTETNQALDFIAMLLLSPGDTVIMEEPVSPDAYRTMELAGGKIITIPMDEDGMKCNILEELVIKHNPKLIYVNSSFHDPTGAILSIERRKIIVEISNKYRIPVIEEDAASELYYEGKKLPPIKSFDVADNIIYIYSFSLTFVPGLSLAFIVGNRELIKSLSYLVSIRMMSADWLAQKLAAKYLADGSYYKLLEDFRSSYKRKLDILCEGLDEMSKLGLTYSKPRGGAYVWCKLPTGVDSKSFINLAYKNKLALIPGDVFYPFKNGGRDFIRINYSFESEERIKRGIEIFKECLQIILAHKK